MAYVQQRFKVIEMLTISSHDYSKFFDLLILLLFKYPAATLLRLFLQTTPMLRLDADKCSFLMYNHYLEVK